MRISLIRGSEKPLISLRVIASIDVYKRQVLRRYFGRPVAGHLCSFHQFGTAYGRRLAINGKKQKTAENRGFLFFILYLRELFQKLGLDAQPDIDYLAALFLGEFLAACCRSIGGRRLRNAPCFSLSLIHISQTSAERLLLFSPAKT